MKKMKITRLTNYLLALSVIIFSGCSKEDNTPPSNIDCNGVENGTSMLDDCQNCQQAYIYNVVTHSVTLLDDTSDVVLGGPTDMLIMPNDPMNPYWNQGCIVAPATYEFSYQGQNTVAYPGQTTRLMMAKQLTDALKNGTHTLTQLQQMWTTGTGFANGIDNPDKILRSKTSASPTASSTVQVQLDDLLINYSDEVLANWNNNASSGVPGAFTTASQGRTVYINAKGMEIDQCFAKALIGALCHDQAVNKYLSVSAVSADNSLRDPLVNSNSTTMEHKWDEGFGYVYGMVANNTTGDLSSDNLLGKYLNKYADKAAVVFDAFKLGRAAISHSSPDYAIRDNQTNTIKNELSNVIALKAIGYLQGAHDLRLDENGNMVDCSADYFHDLSEGWGFILSLQYTDWYTNSEVNTMLSDLEAGNGFWDRTPAELEAMINAIKAKTGL